MPKLVDHEHRRRELAEAVWRVIRRDGVERATVRAVAAESGWSSGALRHYFGTQQELLRFAVELILERVPQRIRAHLAETWPDPLRRAQRLLEELLPLDEERQVEVLVWLAFTDRARVDPVLAQVREQAWDGTRYLCRLVVADLAGLAGLTGRRGPDAVDQVLPEPDHEAAAERLHALVDGLTLQGITYPDRMPPARLRAVLRRHLQTLAAAAVQGGEAPRWGGDGTAGA